MLYRGVKYDIVKDIDVHPCWRWTFCRGRSSASWSDENQQPSCRNPSAPSNRQGIGTEARRSELKPARRQSQSTARRSCNIYANRFLNEIDLTGLNGI